MKRIVVSAALALGACAVPWAQSPARVVTGLEWADRGTWLKAEFHTQTRFSDGGRTIDDVVVETGRHGCDVVAITDHGDGNLKGGTPEYLEAIRIARAAHPETTVIAGMEWNVPPGKGQEHANVLFPSAMETPEVLGEFKERYDDETKEGENPELAIAAFSALTPTDPRALAPVVIFNHPSRRSSSTSAPSLTFEALKRTAPAILIGFEGAPGHQNANPLGAYPSNVLIDRWDPMAATIGGAWDQWLQKGLNVWAALSSSDFHNAPDDFWPCEFSAVHVYAPDRTGDGVIRALRAGSFFAEHGHIVTAARLEARFDGQPHVFVPGETAEASVGSMAAVSLRLTVPPVDYLGRENRIDVVELIGVSQTTSEILFSGAPSTPDAFSVPVKVPAGGIVVRARGRRALDDGTGLMFYTNPIRINAR